MAPSLRTFLAQLEREPREGILRIRREVDARHELSAIVKRLETEGNPTVVFERVRGSSMPVVVAVTGSKERIALALGDRIAECVERLPGRVDAPVPPRRTADAPVQEVVHVGEESSLDELPIPVHAPRDAGRYITAGVLVARDPVTGNVNTGIYRVMVKGPRRLTVNVAPAHDLARIVATAAQEGRTCDFALVLGGHPAVAIASQVKNGLEVDAYGVTGALLGEPLDVVPARTIDLDVPAHAEIVVEGRIEPGHTEAEGPFGEFTYYYGAADAWTGHVSAVTHRRDAMYVDVHPTHVEHRALWLFPGRESRLLSLLRAAIPTVRAVHLPLRGGGLSAFVAMRKVHDGDARRALLLALSADTYTKHAVVVDDDVDIFDVEDVMWALNVRFQGDRDLVVIPGCRGVRTDPSAYALLDRGQRGALTTKLGFDATMPLERPYGPRADALPEAFQQLDLDEYLPADGLPAAMTLGEVRRTS
jgi:2,5-furandicarboxylate decarboxylase 1